jgi:TPR repeat protein
MLGERYLKGGGAKKNEQEGIRLYRAAAIQGYAKAQYSLGKCYQKREGVEENKFKAVCLLKIAADNGHRRASNDLKKLGLNKVMLAVCL